MASEYALTAGIRLARAVFAKRGNHSEAHLGESELAALLAVAVDTGVAKETRDEKSRQPKCTCQHDTSNGAGHANECPSVPGHW